MNPRLSRPLAVAMLALSIGALGAGTASAATPVLVGSVEVCTGIPVGPFEISFCL
ncbi:hypothetical protein ACFU44_05770 [Nocardia rhizosphaerihabitans]|uniref:hypothetical protein n=1 Tax=Nocardia rhizosphaerihabitans TaxID=1691570 RepID=UPI00366CAA66